jgi:hypothetical protein
LSPRRRSLRRRAACPSAENVIERRSIPLVASARLGVGCRHATLWLPHSSQEQQHGKIRIHLASALFVPRNYRQLVQARRFDHVRRPIHRVAYPRRRPGSRRVSREDAVALLTNAAVNRLPVPIKNPPLVSMDALLQFRAHRRAGHLLLPCAGHIVFTTVAGQGWLAGPKPSLDASTCVQVERSAIKSQSRRTARGRPS